MHVQTYYCLCTRLDLLTSSENNILTAHTLHVPVRDLQKWKHFVKQKTEFLKICIVPTIIGIYHFLLSRGTLKLYWFELLIYFSCSYYLSGYTWDLFVMNIQVNMVLYMVFTIATTSNNMFFYYIRHDDIIWWNYNTHFSELFWKIIIFIYSAPKILA